jgi:hypothetical protein
MTGLIKRALTKRIHRKGPSDEEQVKLVEPDEKLVLLVKFAIGMTLCFSALEVAHLVVLGKWSAEIFAAITGLVGTVTGVLIGKHA